MTGSDAIGDATVDCIPGEIPTDPYKSKPSISPPPKPTTTKPLTALNGLIGTGGNGLSLPPTNNVSILIPVANASAINAVLGV